MTKKDELYEQLLAEKERTILLLTAQLELAQRSAPATLNSSDYVPPELNPQQAFELDMQAWIRDEEFDIKDLVADGSLTKEEADAALLEINQIDFN